MTERLQRLHSQAACKGADFRLFFGHEDDDQTMSAAKHLCASCPVRMDCLDYAMVQSIESGIYGGLTASERREDKIAWRSRKVRAGSTIGDIRESFGLPRRTRSIDPTERRRR